MTLQHLISLMFTFPYFWLIAQFKFLYLNTDFISFGLMHFIAGTPTRTNSKGHNKIINNMARTSKTTTNTTTCHYTKIYLRKIWIIRFCNVGNNNGCVWNRFVCYYHYCDNLLPENKVGYFNIYKGIYTEFSQMSPFSNDSWQVSTSIMII